MLCYDRIYTDIPHSGFCMLQFLYKRKIYLTSEIPISQKIPTMPVHVRLNLDTNILFPTGSREQNYRPEECGVCHAGLVGKKGHGFWEGGKGTRDRTRMSRKDPRKFKRLPGGAARKKTTG